MSGDERPLGSGSADGKALDFCLRWLGFWRRSQQGEDDTPYDADGSYGMGPVPGPRSLAGRQPLARARGLATLAIARRAGISAGRPRSPRGPDGAFDRPAAQAADTRCVTQKRLGLLADTQSRRLETFHIERSRLDAARRLRAACRRRTTGEGVSGKIVGAGASRGATLKIVRGGLPHPAKANARSPSRRR